jgi:hypothetical protein
VRDLGSIDFHPPALRGRAQVGPGRLLIRARVRMRRSSLNAALRGGADPCESAALAYNAARLTSQRSREKLARWVDHIVDAAARPSSILAAAVEPPREEVSAAGPALTRISELLRSTTPVYCQGLAMLEELLRDGGGSLYTPARPGALSRDVEKTLAALEGRRDADES